VRERTGGGFAMIGSVRTRPLRLITLGLTLGLVAASTGCITRTVRDTVFDDGYSKVILRSSKKGRQVVPRGFDHPLTIAPVRIAHILSRIDLRRDDEKRSEREPAIPLETLFTVAEGISEGLKKATADQELAVQSIRRDKHWGLFDRFYLTSLLCFVREGLFYVYISRSDWEVPADRRDRLPETWAGKHALDFRLVVERDMTLVDEQGVAVDWRDPLYAKPTRTRIAPGGKVVRRTILMETLEDDTDYGPRPEVGADLTPGQLRALADLEEARRNGELSEAEYTAERNRILRGESPAP
jgi:hypothetical protein